MNILVVDDEIDKVQQIASVLKNAGLDFELVHESTAVAARRKMRSVEFDIVIIDLNLPSGVGEPASNSGGIALLDLLMLDEKIRLPDEIYFITGKEELVEEARNEASKRGAILWQYDNDSNIWKSMLVGKVKYLDKAKIRKLSSLKIDVAIITALHTPELDAVLALPYDWSLKTFPDDPTTYYLGSINREDTVVTFVAVCASRKGMPSSAALSAKMVLQFNPQYLVMLGICAGIPGKVNLGDIVVADPTWDYGSGKRAIDNSNSSVFLASAYQVPLDPQVRQAVSEIARGHEAVKHIRANWNGDVPQGSLTIHLGPMASGASVISDDQESRNVVLQHRDLLAIEMEAYAVMAAAEYSSYPTPKALAIKSVCDFADQHKNDNWQKYAAYTSAAFADQLFRSKGFLIRRS